MSLADDPGPNLNPPINTNHRTHSSVSSIKSANSPRQVNRNLPSPSPRISNAALPDAAGHRYSASASVQSSSHLTPHKLYPRETSLSRSSSRSSLRRAHSPALSLDDPVAVRNQMSTLKHSIRQQQAQLNNLENVVRVGPRPYAPEVYHELNDNIAMSNGSSSYPYPSYSSSPPAASSAGPPPSAFRDFGEGSSTPSTSSPSAAVKMKRRSSYDVLQGIAGPDSNLPLPRRMEGTVSAGDAENGVIREGVPLTFGEGGISASPSSPPAKGHYKRNSSPTRTLSRIPISAVGNARALADEGQGLVTRSPVAPGKLSPSDTSLDMSSSTLPSPSKRLSFTPGNTTKVLADLQTGVVNARNALEHTKSQLRLSQRTVSTLTRQVEDLKESRERLRLENEGLNNVVARKERLLQEVLDRARKAEAEASTLKQQLKTETTTSKKSLKEMEAALAESTALSSKSEREYITLRDSMKGLIEAWKHDTDRLRDDVAKKDARWKAEAEKVGKQYRGLVEEIKKAEAGKERLQSLREEDERKGKEVEAHWLAEIQKMRDQLQENEQKTQASAKTAKLLEEELARLRRLMRAAGRVEGEEGDNTPDS